MFDISEDEELLRYEEDARNNRPVNYRLVICRIIFNSTDFDLETNRTKINNLYDYTQSFDQTRIEEIYDSLPFGHYEPGFIELLTLKTEQNNEKRAGFVVIDRTDGCFPLICYPQINVDTRGRRVNGFKVSVGDVRANLQDILNILRDNANDWDACKEHLKPIFYPGETQAG